MKKKFSSMGRVAIALVLALSLSLVMTVPVSAAALTAVSATPVNATETVETTYTIGFTTATAWGVKYVDMAFDPLFTSTVTSVEVTGIGDGSLTDDVLPDLRYTVDSAELIPAGTAITITFSGVTNPVAGTYEVTVQTLDATPAVIDEGTADVTITPAPDSFEVVAGTDDIVTAGEAFSVTVTALKVDETTETGYAGDYFIDFTQNGGTAGTIPDFELISFTDGVGTSPANFILTVAGEAVTITADALEPTVTGDSDPITINAASLASFTISAPPATVVAGEDFDTTDIIVTAVDADDNTVEDYTGTVTWTSSDPSAELPDAHALVAGTYTFDGEDFTLKTVGEEGTQTITVTAGTVSETSDPITVTPATASEWTVEAEPTSIRADDVNASVITATVFDEFGNVDTNWATNAAFTGNLGDIAGSPATFADGEATATLTSNGEVGTATVKVTSGTLPDETVMVTLVEPSLLAEVWVATDGVDANSGTESSPVLTIQQGIDIAAEDGRVNVLPGVYTLSSMLSINTAGLTVRSTEGLGTTTIDASGLNAVSIFADGVTFEGFTVVITTSFGIITKADNTTITNNMVTCAVTDKIGINLLDDVANAMVSSNQLEGCTIYLDEGVTDSTISWNVISVGSIVIEDDISGLTVTGNIITSSNDAGAIQFGGRDIDDVLIQGNTLSSNTQGGIYVSFWSGLTYVGVTNVTITGNDITDNTGAGIQIDGVVECGEDAWDVTNAINNNNITGNTGGIENDSAVVANAKNNWWDDASGPGGQGPGGGDTVTTNVIYSPWLDAAYAITVDPVTSIELSEGWNLISLPLYIPSENRDPATLLAGLTGVEIVWGNYDPSTGGWNTYDPAQGVNDLTAMSDGKGYWVDMTAADTLDISALGTELPDAPAAPPTYDVVEGWNLIGFKSTTATLASDYLSAIDEQYTMIYGFADGTYFVVSTGNLEPGYGYWIAVTVPGTIYP